MPFLPPNQQRQSTEGIIHIRWNDVTESIVTIRSPFCGYNMTQCVELNGEDLSCYSNETESVRPSLTKCPYDHWLTNKAYLSAITVTNIFLVFTYKMAANIYTGKDREQNDVTVTLYTHRVTIWIESVPKIIINNAINIFLKTAINILAISNHNSFWALFDKIASVYFI